MARSSAALRRPPAPELPSAPAGEFVDDVTGLLGVAVERERRRGRGAQSQRLRPLRADRAHRLRRRLAERSTNCRRSRPRCTIDATRKIITRNDSPDISLRPLDQSLSRLRARLRLLLRAADPRLSRPVARARFRIQAVREAGRGRTAGDANCRRPAISRAAIAIGTNTDPYQPIERRTRSCAASSKCWSAPAIRSASSPSRRWSCATSTSSRAWPSATWPRSRCR